MKFTIYFNIYTRNLNLKQVPKLKAESTIIHQVLISTAGKTTTM